MLLLFVLSEVTFDSRKSALRQQKQKKAERLLTFVTTYHPAVKKLNSLRHVAGANFAQISCCASEKVPAHTRGCAAATCP